MFLLHVLVVVLVAFPSLLKAQGSVIICENEVGTVSCPPNAVISITSASYGRTSKTICPGPYGLGSPQMDFTNCRSNVGSILTNGCSGKNYCSFTFSNAVFGDPCVGTYKYTDVAYTCVGAPYAKCSRGVLTKAKELEIRSALKMFINPFNNGTVQVAQAIRLAFHDCVGGCDGCLNVNDPENSGRFITTFNNLNAMYATNGYSPFLSRADFYALAAIVAIEQGVIIANAGCTDNCTPMPSIEFRYCRQDCPTSPNTAAINGLPNGKINHTQTMNFFSSAFGLDESLATALLGVHTVGFCGGDTASGFSGSWKGLTDANGVRFNIKFNNGYFQNLLNTSLIWTQETISTLGPRWQWFGRLANGTQTSFMLNTDMALLKEITTDTIGKSACTFNSCSLSTTADFVRLYASNSCAWMSDFSTAFQMMINTAGSSILFKPQ